MQAQSLCVKTRAPSLCMTTTTHTQVPHAMTTQAQNPCATTTTLVQGHYATMTMRAQSPCATTSTPAHYDDEGTALCQRHPCTPRAAARPPCTCSAPVP